jgi:hypothetical protein
LLSDPRGWAGGQGAGCKTLRSIAGALQARGVRTPQGKAWSPMMVSNLLKRLAAN